MVKVKICGITNLEDARAAINAGCDALGFVFYRKSRRYIRPEKATKLIRQLPNDLIKIGVFANAQENTIRRIARRCRLNMLQFHGNESAQFCDRFKGFKLIKAFRIKDKLDLTHILRYRTFAYLFDSFAKSGLGGTGKRFNWKLITALGSIKQTIFLSGGLNEKNIRQAIKLARPDWVDASSSLEITPGKKDRKRIKRFIKAAKAK